jgi:arylsulfatase A-like enzyme
VLVLTALLAAPAAAAPEPARRPHVILISIDTLRADHLPTYGYARETAPRIAAFARDAIVFEEAFSQSQKTAESHMSLMTGLYPEVHGVHSAPRRRVTRLSDEIPTLAEALRGAGYRTRALHGGGNVRPALGFDRGFERYDEERDLPASLARARQAILELEATPGAPFFLFLHTYEVHAPYDPPVAHARRFVDPVYAGDIVAPSAQPAPARRAERSRAFWQGVDPSSPEDRRHLSDLYDAGIHQADAQLGAFLDWLEARPVWRDTLIVLLSDHGEEFGEHGKFQHSTLHREALHVPLVIRFPGDDPVTRPRRIPAVVRLIDVKPTLLEFLDVPAPPHLQGRSLLPLLRGEPAPPRPVLSQTLKASRAALRDGDWKLIRDERGEQLYRVSSDRGERRDLRADEPERAAELAARLDALLAESAALRDSFAAPGTQPIDPQALEQLRALGYLPPEAEPSSR